MRDNILPRPHRLLWLIGVSSLVAVGFWVARYWDTGSTDYWFLNWNLFLAWPPLVFGWWLATRLRHSRWLSPGNLVLTFLWLGFLPNTFYMVSDLIHIGVTGEISVLFDAVMLMAFIWSGFLLGFVSIYVVHRQLRRRIGTTRADITVGVILFLCSFAIYLGRYLRWSSWDVLVNPAGVLFDVSDPFINPSAHPQAFTTTIMFFVLLGSIYFVTYQLVQLARESTA